MNIRAAKEEDSSKLTAISFRAKGHWPYPAEYFKIWESELTITPEYIARNIVNLAEAGSLIVGYYSLTGPNGQPLTASNECYLDHMYILPEFIGRKIGTSLYKHAQSAARLQGFREMLALVDPNAKGFYEKMQARHVYDTHSNIPGRIIPVFRIECE